MRERIDIDAAAERLLQGGAVMVDTDTVAGMAVSANSAEALQALYDAKGREENKPVAWLVSDECDLFRYGQDVPEYAIALAQKYWPGALTLVVEASSEVDRAFVAADGSIGLRMPDDDACRDLARRLGGALATTSANLSGASAPRFAKDIDDGFASDVPILEGSASSQECISAGGSSKAMASTVIDCRSSRPSLIREGTIPFSEIVEVVDGTTGDTSCE